MAIHFVLCSLDSIRIFILTQDVEQSIKYAIASDKNEKRVKKKVISQQIKLLQHRLPLLTVREMEVKINYAKQKN